MKFLDLNGLKYFWEKIRDLLFETSKKCDTLQESIGFERKNILKNTLNAFVESGMRFFTNKDNGSITVNGAATADTICKIGDIAVNGKKSYILSGCPAGGSNSSYQLICRNADGDIQNTNDYGNGVEFEIDENFSVYIKVSSGTVIENLVFYPMIRSSAINDSSYEPYVETISEQLGNFGNLPAINSSTLGYSRKNLLEVTAASTTINGVTMTVNSDGTLALSGTATERTVIPITPTRGRNSISYLPTNFILSGGDQMLGVECCIGVEVSTGANSGYVASFYDGDNGRSVDLSEYPTAKYWYAYMRIYEGVNVDGMTIYPMIRASNIKDFDYEPYVPSVLDHIKKLEDRVAVLEGSAPASILDVNSLDSNAFKIQNIDGENELIKS